MLKNVIKRRVEQLGEVAMVDINGLVHTVVQIEPDKSKMLSLGISNEDIYSILSKTILIMVACYLKTDSTGIRYGLLLNYVLLRILVIFI